jgi:uncharacterized protein (DUF1697 family)
VPTHVALLRGINVGGNNKLPMAELRDILTSLGHADVATYIQSGNVVFTAAAAGSGKAGAGKAGAGETGGGQSETSEIAAAIQAEIASRVGFEPAVLVLTRDELAQVIADNPYPQETNHRSLHAVFRRQEMTAAELEAVAAAIQRARAKDTAAGKPGHDDATVVGRTLFLHTPDGFGRSELAVQLSKTGAAMSARSGGTARNWATVTKLRALLDG